MRSSLVLTVIGADRPGLIESIAQAVMARDGNWVESRMARLAGQFAGILLVDVPAAQRQSLADALRELENQGLNITLEAAPSEVAETADASEAAGSASSEPDVSSLRFELVGQDRPGIVRDITHVLAQRGVNIVELWTQIVSAPMTGEPLFHAEADLHVPTGESVEGVRDALEAIATDLMVDITFNDETPS